jgi:hypothetical protein
VLDEPALRGPLALEHADDGIGDRLRRDDRHARVHERVAERGDDRRLREAGQIALMRTPSAAKAAPAERTRPTTACLFAA